MSTRIHIVVSDEELAVWRLAAGDVPLSRWVRRCVEGALVASAVVPDVSDAYVPLPDGPVWPATIREWRGPDPKSGKKRS